MRDGARGIEPGRYDWQAALGAHIAPGMPQAQLPLFPASSTRLNEHLGFTCCDGQITYFNGQLPVFTHAENDLASFRLFTSQLVANGSATPGVTGRSAVARSAVIGPE